MFLCFFQNLIILPFREGVEDGTIEGDFDGIFDGVLPGVREGPIDGELDGVREGGTVGAHGQSEKVFCLSAYFYTQGIFTIPLQR